MQLAQDNNLHGAQGISELCSRLGPGWRCEGSETSTGFFMELLKTTPPTPHQDLTQLNHCSSFLLSDELHWRPATRALFYTLGLLYCFLGLAVITGIYMKALDRIVKHSRKIVQIDPVTRVTTFREELVWNSTLADITLLALGTCAPQVSLALIDAFQHLGDSSGNELGAGTLLGSTAFNLFVILAVCVVVPKSFETKSIKNVGVYVVELAWSFWAYLWLFLILQVWTPEEITLWEALCTVVQFPLLVLHAYVQDKSSRSIPAAEQNPITNFEELSTISRSSNYANRGSENPDSSTNELRLNSDESLDLFERSRTPEEFRAQSGAPTKLTWRELGLLWKNQFYEAMSVTGRADEPKQDPTIWQLILHPISSQWKLSFAFIPPVELLHGWLSFLSSIGFITWISFLIVELSNRFNCVTGWSSYTLALTLLATGTSFPNLVASKIAAEEQETADSAIANINASNCINVFVGFGLPWCISAAHTLKSHQPFRVPAHGLGFLLSIYFATAFPGIAALTARRRFLGGELGGSRRWAWASACLFLLLWGIFLAFACSADKST